MTASTGKPRGRQKGVVLTEEHRDKIRKSNIFSNLIRHAEGKKELNQSQVTVSLALLKKILPDLQSIELKGDDENPVKHEHSVSPALEEVASLLSGIAAREREE